MSTRSSKETLVKIFIFLIWSCKINWAVQTISGGSRAYWFSARKQYCWLWHGLVRILSQRWMGHSKCACGKTYKVLSLLSRALSRYLFQHGHSTQATFLHCQFDYSLCRNLLPFDSCILFACSIKTKNSLGHCYSCLANPVFHSHHWGKTLTNRKLRYKRDW